MTLPILTHLRNAANACDGRYECPLSIAEIRQIVAHIDAQAAEIAALKQQIGMDPDLEQVRAAVQAQVDAFVEQMKTPPAPKSQQ